MAINQAVLEGYIGFYSVNNPEDEKKICVRFGLNVKSKWRKDPEDKEKYAYDNFICKAFGSQALYIHKYKELEKGDLITVTGDVYLEEGYSNATTGKYVDAQLAIRVSECGTPLKKNPMKEKIENDTTSNDTEQPVSSNLPTASQPSAALQSSNTEVPSETAGPKKFNLDKLKELKLKDFKG